MREKPMLVLAMMSGTSADGIDVTRAEFEYAVTHEGALDVDDILDRRTRIGLVSRDRERVVGVAQEFLAGVAGA